MADIEILKQFKAKIRRLAEANNDEFVVAVRFDEKGWHVEVAEKADKHVLIEGHSNHALWMALDSAECQLPSALEQWGYRDLGEPKVASVPITSRGHHTLPWPRR